MKSSRKWVILHWTLLFFFLTFTLRRAIQCTSGLWVDQLVHKTVWLWITEGKTTPTSVTPDHRSTTFQLLSIHSESHFLTNETICSVLYVWILSGLTVNVVKDLTSIPCCYGGGHSIPGLLDENRMYVTVVAKDSVTTHSSVRELPQRNRRHSAPYFTCPAQSCFQVAIGK